MTDEEFEEIWAKAMAREERLRKKREALSAEEKERLDKEFSDPFYERISDNPFGNDDD